MPATVADAVLQTVKAVWQRFEAQDPQGMLALLAEEYTVWDTFQPQLVTKETIAAYVRKDFAQSAARGPLTRRTADYVIDVWGDTALVRFTTWFQYQPPNPVSHHGRTTVVLRRRPEGWRLVHVHEGERPSGSPPIAPP